MSIEAPNTVEETPVVTTKPVEPKHVPSATGDLPVPELFTAQSTSATSDLPVPEIFTAQSTPATGTGSSTVPAAAEKTVESKPLENNKVAIAAQPASEGTLGYKEPGFLKYVNEPVITPRRWVYMLTTCS